MDIGVFIPILALIIPIVAIVCATVVKPWLAMKERQMDLESKMVAEKAAQYAAHKEQLEQRVRVLERIVTDKGITVADEIERLRDAPIN